jgi:hypothetical protein
MYHVTELHNIQIGFLTEKQRLTAEQKLERVAMLEEINLFTVLILLQRKKQQELKHLIHVVHFSTSHLSL